MSKHTTGPWYPRWGGEPGFIYSPTAQKVVAEVPHEKSDAVERNDSQLIAAAPDLLAALEAMIAVHVEGHLLRSEAGLGDDEMVRAMAHAESAARAAIAKAEGKAGH